MFRCYRCGQNFDNAFIRRRTVSTGYSLGLGSFRRYYRDVSLCPECDRRYAEEEKWNRVIYIAAAVLMAIFLFGPKLWAAVVEFLDKLRPG